MARLVPNPIGDIMQPLQRVEHAIGDLGESLHDLHMLPEIRAQLGEVNANLGQINEGIAAILVALGDLGEALRDPAVAPPAAGAPRAKRSRPGAERAA